MFNLEKFKLPKDFRGRKALFVQLWWCVQATLFSCSPQFMYKWRAFLLRLFGANVGKGVLIRPSVKITYPWKLTIGENSWVGDDVVLYTLGEIKIGNNTIISQHSYLCTGTHDYNSELFDIIQMPIRIGNSSWLATDVFIAPGITIGNECIIGARSSVYKSFPDKSICYGNPAELIRYRS